MSLIAKYIVPNVFHVTSSDSTGDNIGHEVNSENLQLSLVPSGTVVSEPLMSSLIINVTEIAERTASIVSDLMDKSLRSDFAFRWLNVKRCRRSF